MKKYLTGILALGLAAAMSIPAFAANATNDGTNNTDVDINGTFHAGPAAAEVIAVDLVWDDMSFTYTGPSRGTWNPATHQYENPIPGSWAPTSGTAPKITLTNHSNVDVKAAFAFTAEVEGVKGSFTKDVLLLNSADGTEAADAPQDETAFTVDGSGIDADRELGTITVSIKDNRQYVSTAEELAAAVKNNGIIRLTNDITNDQAFFVPQYKDVTIDLNGHTLTGSGDVVIENKGTVTLRNGTVAGTGTAAYSTVYNNTNGILVAENLTVTAKSGKAFVAQEATKTEFNGCTLQSEMDYALHLLYANATVVDCQITTSSSTKTAIMICSDSSDPVVLNIGGNTEVNTYIGMEGSNAHCMIYANSADSFDLEEHIISALYTLISVGTNRWMMRPGS